MLTTDNGLERRSVVFPTALMFNSMFVSLCLMVILTLEYFAAFRPAISKYSEVQVFVLFNIDVLLWQSLSLLLLIFIAYQTFSKHLSDIKTLTAVASYCVLVILIITALEVYVLKPTFKYNRPTTPIVEPVYTEFLSSWLRQLFRISSDSVGTSTPSGYALRQTVIFLATLFVYAQKRVKKHIAWIVIVTSAIITIFVCAQRVFILSHTVFDLGISIGLGTLIFWIVIFVTFFRSETVRRNMGIITLT